METIFRTDHLTNGLCVEFIDHSNRYFGDYHRLQIEIRCRIVVTPHLFTAAEDPCAEAEKVRGRLGNEVLWVRHIERMGVAGGDLEKVRGEMIDSFVKSSFGYLQSPLFPSRFIAAQMAENRKALRPFRLVK